mmetsp:Transcript_51/g.51  ORF Transcript_51/g.51 Transcript_51/m.51 type:complete len:103 (-) Transcript_51:346-654(-)
MLALFFLFFTTVLLALFFLVVLFFIGVQLVLVFFFTLEVLFVIPHVIKHTAFPLFLVIFIYLLDDRANLQVFPLDDLPELSLPVLKDQYLIVALAFIQHCLD